MQSIEKLTRFQRTDLGDPLFVQGMDKYQQSMLNQSTINEIRSRINDSHTLDVSAYDPSGIESLDTYVPPALLNNICIQLTSGLQAWDFSHRFGRPHRSRCLVDQHGQLTVWQPDHGS